MNQFGWKLLLVAASLATLVIAPACSDTEGDGTEETDEDDNNGGGRPGGGGGGTDGEDEEDAGTGGGLDASITPDTGESDAGGESDSGGGGSEPDPDEFCPLLADSPQAGQPCTGNTPDECGTTGQCLQLQTDTSPTCYTICLPDLCGDTCNGAESCLPLVSVNPDTNEQTPAEVDLDGDGVDETQLGACSEPPVGDVELYDTCTPSDACAAGLRCIGYTNTAGVCASTCSTDADCSVGGIDGSCETVTTTTPGGETSDEDLCLLPCTPGGDPSACPDGFSCTAALGQGLCTAN